MASIELTDKEINNISQKLDMGMVCFIHRQTGEIVIYPDLVQFGDYIESDTDVWDEPINKVKRESENFVQIYAMESHDSYEVMEEFANSLPESKFKDSLLEALSNRKPFRNFKHLVEGSDLRDDWFAFKNESNRKFVEHQIERKNEIIEFEDEDESEGTTTKSKPLNEIFNEDQLRLLAILKERFEKFQHRHPHIEWQTVVGKLMSQPEKLVSLKEMEQTGGEPDVVELGDFYLDNMIHFVDCSEESPTKRRSLCYDKQALESRKKNKPENSAEAKAKEMDIYLLTEQEYITLQKFGPFDTNTSSWLKTPKAIRERGGAIFGDYRFGRVFIYHNRAESYYAARGFRGVVTLD